MTTIAEIKQELNDHKQRLIEGRALVDVQITALEGKIAQLELEQKKAEPCPLEEGEAVKIFIPEGATLEEIRLWNTEVSVDDVSVVLRSHWGRPRALEVARSLTAKFGKRVD